MFGLFAKLRHRIIIFTTHRYDSIPQDTPIVVLVDGRITEAGTHEELLVKEQDYWSLYMTAARPDFVKVRNSRTTTSSKPVLTKPFKQLRVEGNW